ncbi:hypothetical protein F471_00651 [Pseudomonas sp. URMO17WK12:I1]|uniref:YgaP family membrane protein n=1 Tax=unclassified Pseudomonas TaxID=196821 RepID=UPI0004802EB7|nr:MULTISPECIES: DUF2892 domain-containing protein [unclassified Pseudomonas]PZW71576.1 hypothetical protein F471_00651 [Pseudomonas sp. URMO17WK12:I1]
MRTQNVAGTERLLSLAIGTMGMISGIRQGGAAGLLKVGASAMLAKRGLTGHCQFKSLLTPATERPSGPQATHSSTDASKLDEDRRMENALEETFPASDPISP